MDYSGWGDLVKKRFPDRSAEEVDRAWAKLKLDLQVGQSVRGEVIAKAPFGAWLDIGCGFPALLEIVCIAGLIPGQYRADEWCPIGSEQQAFIGGFNDRNKQVSIWQVKPGGPNASL